MLVQHFGELSSPLCTTATESAPNRSDAANASRLGDGNQSEGGGGPGEGGGGGGDGCRSVLVLLAGNGLTSDCGVDMDEAMRGGFF